MAETLSLIGFHHSVYTRIVRMALAEMGLQARYIEVNPFADEADPVLAAHSPFGRVPVLRDGDFVLTETAAILRYLDALGNDGSMVPEGAQSGARMAQVIGIVDAYGYQPMVRQVFSHGYYRPLMGEEADPEMVAQGLRNSAPVLRMLDRIAAEGLVLNARRITLADLHLAPMIDYFTRVRDGAAAMAEFPALNGWWAVARERPSLNVTDPFTQR